MSKQTVLTTINYELCHDTEALFFSPSEKRVSETPEGYHSRCRSPIGAISSIKCMPSFVSIFSE